MIELEENVTEKPTSTESVPKWTENSTHFTGGKTLEDLRIMQTKFCIERDWTKNHAPRNVLLALMGEVGELSEIFQWKGEVEHGAPNFTAREKEHLGEELSDVFIYLTRLADVSGVDLGAAVERKFKLNAMKYPAPETKDE